MVLVWFLASLATAQGATTRAGGWWTALFVYAMWLNLYMFLFNMLVPCFPLDCSQILCSAMLIRGHDAPTTAKMIVLASVPIVLALGAWGLYTFVTSGTGILTVFMALWLAKQTADLKTSADENRLDEHPLFRHPPALPPQGHTGQVFSPMTPTVTAVPVTRNECNCSVGACVALALATCELTCAACS